MQSIIIRSVRVVIVFVVNDDLVIVIIIVVCEQLLDNLLTSVEKSQ